MSNEERIECIRSAGIVGHGGATFPTHVKIQSGIGKCDTVIINAAECEPYITSDHRLLLERPEETIGGLKPAYFGAVPSFFWRRLLDQFTATAPP